MKTLLSLFGGAVTLTEQSGVFALNFDASLGGGEAAGIIVGSGSVKLSAAQGLQLAEKLLNGALPASAQALATVVEGIVNQAVSALE